MLNRLPYHTDKFRTQRRLFCLGSKAHPKTNNKERKKRRVRKDTEKGERERERGERETKGRRNLMPDKVITKNKTRTHQRRPAKATSWVGFTELREWHKNGTMKKAGSCFFHAIFTPFSLRDILCRLTNHKSGSNG